MDQCCHFVEFHWHENGQAEQVKKITSISSFSPIIAVGRRAWLCVCVRSDAVWFSQTCLAYRLCLSLRDGIFCHSAVWILILDCRRVMESHCQIDMTHSPAGSLLPDQFVCCDVISHWPAALKDDGWPERESEQRSYHLTADLPPALQPF